MLGCVVRAQQGQLAVGQSSSCPWGSAVAPPDDPKSQPGTSAATLSPGAGLQPSRGISPASLRPSDLKVLYIKIYFYFFIFQSTSVHMNAAIDVSSTESE